MADNLIRHLVPADYFRALAASEPYLPSQFPADGFIHCTQEPEVLREVANRYYWDIYRSLTWRVVAF